MQALRIADVSEKTGLAQQTIRNWTSLNRFPRPFKLSSTVAVWDAADIDQWLLSKKQGTCGANQK
jgi:predicted DNA-binding transcriptional regulator AlpA